MQIRSGKDTQRRRVASNRPTTVKCNCGPLFGLSRLRPIRPVDGDKFLGSLSGLHLPLDLLMGVSLANAAMLPKDG